MLEYDAMDKSQSRERERILGQFYRERLLSEAKFEEMWEELNEEQSREFWEQMRQRDSRSKHLAREVSKHWMPLYRREETETRRLERVAQSELQLVRAQLPLPSSPRDQPRLVRGLLGAQASASGIVLPDSCLFSCLPSLRSYMPIDIGGGQGNKELVCWGVAEYSPWVVLKSGG